MRSTIIVALFVLIDAFAFSFVAADVVVFKDSTKAVVYGRVVSRSDSVTTIAAIQKTAGQSPQRMEIPNEQIELVVRNFDENRLAGLNPSNLAAYQTYAIELAAQQVDPVARDLAIRLHMIVVEAANDTQPNARSLKLTSLRQLVEIARNENERGQFELLRKLEVGDRNSNQQKASDQVDAAGNRTADNETVVKVIQLIRRNQRTKAISELAKPAIANLFERWSPVLSADEIRRIAGQNGLSRTDLQKLLTIELAISRGDSPKQTIAGISAKRTKSDWGEMARQTIGAELKLPRLSEINEIDPRLKIYRDGEWLRDSR